MIRAGVIPEVYWAKLESGTRRSGVWKKGLGLWLPKDVDAGSGGIDQRVARACSGRDWGIREEQFISAQCNAPAIFELNRLDAILWGSSVGEHSILARPAERVGGDFAVCCEGELDGVFARVAEGVSMHP